MKKLAWVCTSALAIVLITACGGGGSGGGGSTPATAAPSSSTYVAFTVTAPQGQTLATKRRPAFTAPGGTASLTFKLASNNGTAVTGNSTSFNTSGSNCTPAQNPTSCTFTVTAPSGNDVFYVITYAKANEQGSPTGAGSVTVTAASGTTTTAPTVLNGTVSTIALSLVTQYVPEGDAVALPIALVAKDANGNTIIGMYSNPITVTDTDASQQTKLSATSIPDSTTSLTLSYLGGPMSQAATIVATASGATASNTLTFPAADNGYPVVNGESLTYGTWLNGEGGGGSVGSTPPPLLNSHGSGETGTETVTISTNASFNGQTNVIDIRTQTSPTPLPAVSVDAYYQWNTTATSASLVFLGSSSTSTTNQDPLNNYLSGAQTVTCTAPYQIAWILPLPQSWDALAGTGPCTIVSSNSTGSLSGTETLNADGSYTATVADQGAQLATVSSDGTASGWYTYATGGGMPPVTTDYAAYVVVSTPQPGASVPYLLTTVTGAIPSPGATQTPAPVAETAPNVYLASGLTNGTIPQPLADTAYTNKGNVTTLPTACAVSPTVVGTNPTYTEVDESQYQADPLGNYISNQYRYFTLNGIGIVCVTENSQVNGASYLYEPPASIDSAYTEYAAYITASTLTAAQATTRDRPSALRVAQLGLFAVLRAHDHAMQLRVVRHTED